MSDDKATDAEGLRLVEELLDDDDPSGLSREGRRLAARVGEPYVEGGCVHFPGGRVMTLDWTGVPVALRDRALAKLSPEERAFYERLTGKAGGGTRQD